MVGAVRGPDNGRSCDTGGMVAPLRRFVFRLAGFLALSAGTFAAAEALAVATIDDAVTPKFREVFEGATDWEGLIMGTSRALNGIAPAALDRPGERWYNLAIRGAPISYFHSLWPLYRATGRKPKRLLYAADPFVLGGSLGRQLEHDAASLPLGVYLRWLAEPARNQALLLPNRFRLHQARREWQYALTHGHMEHQETIDRDGIDRGFEPLRGATAPGSWKPYAEVHQIWPKIEARFEAYLRAWQAEGVAIALVQPPEYAPDPRTLAVSNPGLARLAARLGVPFLDYNGPLRGPLNDDAANFVDRGHLSGDGARAFSRRLAMDLAQNWK